MPQQLLLRNKGAAKDHVLQWTKDVMRAGAKAAHKWLKAPELAQADVSYEEEQPTGEKDLLQDPREAMMARERFWNRWC